MPVPNKGIFIIGAKRTPFCQYGGLLRETPASYVFAAAAKGAIQAARLDPADVDDTIVGNVNYLSQCDGGKTPRHCGLYSGVPVERPALGVSKGCGSGLQAVITGAVDILFGTSQVALTGGTDVMSTLPMLVRNVRFGTTLSIPYVFEDHIQRDLVKSYSGLSLSMIAEDVAARYNIGRREADEYALNSYLKRKAAEDSKSFADEITSLTVDIKKEIIVDQDQQEYPNFDQLKDLKASVKSGGVVTRGNSAAPSDGAAVILLASEEAVRTHTLEPMVRVAGWACGGTDSDMGIVAAVAIRRLLDELKMTVNDVDLFEINETFASQVLATAMELKVDLGKVNVNGGALALGHPVSATGARMAVTLVHELRRRNAKRAVAASSCGGGQGIAVMLEKL